MIIEVDDLEEIMELLEEEGNPKILLAPVNKSSDLKNIPEEWRAILTMKDSGVSGLRKLWSGLEDFLPSLINSVEAKLMGVGFVTTDVRGPSLLYFFVSDEELYAHRGFMGIQKLPEVADRLSVNILPFYRIHNGWTDIFSDDSGPLPAEAWEVVATKDTRDSEGLLTVFRTGANRIAFDLENTPAEPYVIWSEGDAEAVVDFWGRLDQWLVDGLEDMDDREV
jgi:hypothetical protein